MPIDINWCEVIYLISGISYEWFAILFYFIVIRKYGVINITFYDTILHHKFNYFGIDIIIIITLYN